MCYLGHRDFRLYTIFLCNHLSSKSIPYTNYHTHVSLYSSSKKCAILVIEIFVSILYFSTIIYPLNLSPIPTTGPMRQLFFFPYAPPSSHALSLYPPRLPRADRTPTPSAAAWRSRAARGEAVRGGARRGGPRQRAAGAGQPRPPVSSPRGGTSAARVREGGGGAGAPTARTRGTGGGARAGLLLPPPCSPRWGRPAGEQPLRAAGPAGERPAAAPRSLSPAGSAPARLPSRLHPSPFAACGGAVRPLPCSLRRRLGWRAEVVGARARATRASLQDRGGSLHPLAVGERGSSPCLGEGT